MKKNFFARLSAVVGLLMVMLLVPGRSSAVTVNESDVTLLEAIKSSGAQAFNTGYTHKSNTRVEMDCNVTKNSQRDWEALFGGRLKDFRSNAFCFFVRHHNGTTSAQDAPCFNRTGKETNGSGFVYGERIKVVAEGQTAKWYRYSDLNTQVGSVTTSGTADDGKTPMFLFNLNTASTEGGKQADTSPSVMTLYGCKIYEGETLKCDFVPAKYNGTVGLYDRVNKTFDGSMTSTPFQIALLQAPIDGIFSGTELLKNSQCDGTFNNWTPTGGNTPRKTWAIKTFEDGTKGWASSCEICTLSQTVVLSECGFSDADIDAGKVLCQASADIISTWNSNNKGARVADVKVDILDENDLLLCTLTVLDDLSIFEEWTTFKSDGFILPLGARKLNYIARGQDPLFGEGWLDQYGPAYKDLSLKANVIGDKPSGGGDNPTIPDNPTYQEYSVWIGGTQVTSENMNDILGDGTMSYMPDKGEGTLTITTPTPNITGYNWGGAMILCSNQNLTVNAPNGLELKHDQLNYGFYVGTGSLTINGNLSGGTRSNEIYLVKGDLTVNGNITFANEESWGILVFGAVDIHGDVDIKAYNRGIEANSIKVKGNLTASSVSDYFYTLQINNGGNLTVEGNVTGTHKKCVISTSGDVNITGDVTLTTTEENASPIGISGDVNIKGNVDITMEKTGNNGIRANNITIDGDVTIDGGHCALSASNTLTMVSGRWNLNAIDWVVSCINMVIPDTHAILVPTGGTVNTSGYIVDANGDMVGHVVIGKVHVHTPTTIPGTQPSCTEPGCTESVVCSECGEVIEAAMEIPALGHIWGDWVVTREAEPGKPGEETRTCMNDASHKETRAIEYQLAIDEKNFPDAAFRKFVQENFDNNNDQKLNDAEIAAVDHIEAMNLGIADLTGIEHFTALTSLTIHYNKLTKLDVSKNTALTSLACGENLLTELDVSKNTALKLLACPANQLTKLDLSNNKALTSLSCHSNKIHDEAMDALIASLPEVTKGEFYAVDPTNEAEENVVTKAQVAEAKKKGWTTYRISENTALWYEEYEGYEPPVPDDISAAKQSNDTGNWYDLKGRKLSGKPTKKGLYIRRSAEGRLQGKNGQKVVID